MDAATTANRAAVEDSILDRLHSKRSAASSPVVPAWRTRSQGLRGATDVGIVARPMYRYAAAQNRATGPTKRLMPRGVVTGARLNPPPKVIGARCLGYSESDGTCATRDDSHRATDPPPVHPSRRCRIGGRRAIVAGGPPRMAALGPHGLHPRGRRRFRPGLDPGVAGGE